jgi:hypothetical protein
VVTELRFDPPRRGNRPRDLSSIQSVEGLPPYLAEVVEAVTDGIHTTREYAERHNISISNACVRFRVARKLGWIKISDNVTSIDLTVADSWPKIKLLAEPAAQSVMMASGALLLRQSNSKAQRHRETRGALCVLLFLCSRIRRVRQRLPPASGSERTA